jgi:hypothetical protein
LKSLSVKWLTVKTCGALSAGGGGGTLPAAGDGALRGAGVARARLAAGIGAATRTAGRRGAVLVTDTALAGATPATLPAAAFFGGAALLGGASCFTVVTLPAAARFLAGTACLAAAFPVGALTAAGARAARCCDGAFAVAVDRAVDALDFAAAFLAAVLPTAGFVGGGATVFRAGVVTDFFAAGAVIFLAGDAPAFFAAAATDFFAGAAVFFLAAAAAGGPAFPRTRAAAFSFADCARPEVALAITSSLFYVSVENSIDRMRGWFQEGVTKLIADGLPTLISTPVRIRLPDDWSM